MKTSQIAWVVLVVWLICLVVLRLFAQENPADSAVYSPRVLIEALEHCAPAGALEPEQVAVVRYACSRISPQTPAELAYIAACCAAPAHGRVMVDEYVSRAGREDFGADDICRYTRGILIYQEQSLAVIEGLTGRRGMESRLILGRIIREELEAKDICNMMSAASRRYFIPDDVSRIVADIRWAHTHGGGRSLSWCLAVADYVVRSGSGV